MLTSTESKRSDSNNMKFNNIIIILIVLAQLLFVISGNTFTLANGTNRSVVNNLGEEYRWNSPIITWV